MTSLSKTIEEFKTVFGQLSSFSHYHQTTSAFNPSETIEQITTVTNQLQQAMNIESLWLEKVQSRISSVEADHPSIKCQSLIVTCNQSHIKQQQFKQVPWRHTISHPIIPVLSVEATQFIPIHPYVVSREIKIVSLWLNCYPASVSITQGQTQRGRVMRLIPSRGSGYEIVAGQLQSQQSTQLPPMTIIVYSPCNRLLGGTYLRGLHAQGAEIQTWSRMVQIKQYTHIQTQLNPKTNDPSIKNIQTSNKSIQQSVKSIQKIAEAKQQLANNLQLLQGQQQNIFAGRTILLLKLEVQLTQDRQWEEEISLDTKKTQTKTQQGTNSKQQLEKRIHTNRLMVSSKQIKLKNPQTESSVNLLSQSSLNQQSPIKYKKIYLNRENNSQPGMSPNAHQKIRLHRGVFPLSRKLPFSAKYPITSHLIAGRMLSPQEEVIKIVGQQALVEGIKLLESERIQHWQWIQKNQCKYLTCSISSKKIKSSSHRPFLLFRFWLSLKQQHKNNTSPEEQLELSPKKHIRQQQVFWKVLVYEHYGLTSCPLTSVRHRHKLNEETDQNDYKNEGQKEMNPPSVVRQHLNTIYPLASDPCQFGVVGDSPIEITTHDSPLIPPSFIHPTVIVINSSVISTPRTPTKSERSVNPQANLETNSFAFQVYPPMFEAFLINKETYMNQGFMVVELRRGRWGSFAARRNIQTQGPSMMDEEATVLNRQPIVKKDTITTTPQTVPIHQTSNHNKNLHSLNPFYYWLDGWSLFVRESDNKLSVHVKWFICLQNNMDLKQEKQLFIDSNLKPHFLKYSFLNTVILLISMATQISMRTDLNPSKNSISAKSVLGTQSPQPLLANPQVLNIPIKQQGIYQIRIWENWKGGLDQQPIANFNKQVIHQVASNTLKLKIKHSFTAGDTKAEKKDQSVDHSPPSKAIQNSNSQITYSMMDDSKFPFRVETIYHDQNLPSLTTDSNSLLDGWSLNRELGEVVRVENNINLIAQNSSVIPSRHQNEPPTLIIHLQLTATINSASTMDIVIYSSHAQHRGTQLGFKLVYSREAQPSSPKLYRLILLCQKYREHLRSHVSLQVGQNKPERDRITTNQPSEATKRLIKTNQMPVQDDNSKRVELQKAASPILIKPSKGLDAKLKIAMGVRKPQAMG